MANFISAASYAASQALASQGSKVKHSHLGEVIAALLGYRTYAALSLEEGDATLDYHLDDAEIMVLNAPMGLARVRELNVAPSDEDGQSVVNACISAVKSGADANTVFVGVTDFYDSHAREALAEVISSSDELANAMAESNAFFPDEPDMQLECPSTADLWAAVGEWSIEADGNMAGHYDPEGDRMFNGNTLNCRGRLTYLKAGRAGLVFLDGDGTGGTDDSWRDRDREDELAYLNDPGRP